MPATKTPDQEDLSRARDFGGEDYRRKMVDPYKRRPQSSSSQPDTHNFGLPYDGSDDSDDDQGSQNEKTRDVAAKEQNPEDISARKDKDIGSQEDEGWKVDVQPRDNRPQPSFAHRLKKKRNAILVTLTLFAGVAGFFSFIGGAAGILIHFKEVWVSKFSDRTQTRQQARIGRIVAKQLSEDPLTAGCGLIKVKCRYKGMTDRQLKKFESRNPGVEIRADGKTAFGRHRVTSIGFTDDDGTFKHITAKDFVRASKKSFAFQQLIYKYNKSKVAIYRDQLFGKLSAKLGLFFGKHTSNKSPPETIEDAKNLAKIEEEAEKAKVAVTEADTKSKINKSNVFGVLCAVKEIITASELLSKVGYMAKMAYVASLIYNIADTIKSGNATGDSGVNNQIALVAGMLTKIDRNGQTASDSFGFQYASRGVLTKDKYYKKYQMGGASDTGVIGQVTRGASSIPGMPALTAVTSVALNKSICNFMGGPFGTGLACAGSIAAAVASAGIASGLAVVACVSQQVIISKLIGIALPILLKQVVKTTDLDGIKGGEVGDAGTGGASAMASLDGRYHGEMPSTKSQVKRYDAFSDNAQGGGNWEDTSSAIDIHNPNSFVGKLATAFLPPIMQLSASASSAPSVLANLPSMGLSQFISTSNAQSVIDGEYDQCDDADYKEVGVATNPFCVPQYGLDPSMSLGDTSYNKPTTALRQDKPASQNPLAWLFQDQTAHAATGDDTRGVTPDNRFDADFVRDYMCGQASDNDIPCKAWIDSDGEAIPYDVLEDDYADYKEQCLETIDPIGPDSPDMCKPKECTAASSDSNIFRYCMYSQYAEDSGIDDQLEDRDADVSGGGGSDSAASSPSEIAGATINMADLAKQSKSIACAEGTKDLGIQDGYTAGKKIPIRICAIPGFPSTGEESNGKYGVTGAGGDAVVNSRVSGAVKAMVAAAKADGVNLTANSSFRSMAHQQALCPCDGIHVAKPGNSNHQLGVAIDFGGGLPSTPGPISGNAFWKWLSEHADEYGYKNYPAEAWHWSPTGN